MASKWLQRPFFVSRHDLWECFALAEWKVDALYRTKEWFRYETLLSEILVIDMFFCHISVPQWQPNRQFWNFCDLDIANLFNDEIVQNGKQKLHEMSVRVAVKILMDVMKKLPIPLKDNEERNTIRQIEIVITKAFVICSKKLEAAAQHTNADPHRAMLHVFDIKLMEVLKEVEFEDYHADPEVLKKAIRQETLREALPSIIEVDNQDRGRMLENIFG